MDCLQVARDYSMHANARVSGRLQSATKRRLASRVEMADKNGRYIPLHSAFLLPPSPPFRFRFASLYSKVHPLSFTLIFPLLLCSFPLRFVSLTQSIIQLRRTPNAITVEPRTSHPDRTRTTVRRSYIPRTRSHFVVALARAPFPSYSLRCTHSTLPHPSFSRSELSSYPC